MAKNKPKKRDVRTEMGELGAMSATEMTGAIPALLPLEQQGALLGDLFTDGEQKAAKKMTE